MNDMNEWIWINDEWINEWWINKWMIWIINEWWWMNQWYNK